MKHIKTYFFIISGALFLSFGLRFFLVPVKLSSGGVGTVSTIILYLFRIPLAISSLIINGFLFIFGYKFLGKDALFKTIAGILASSFFLAAFENAGLLTEDILLSSLSGGILIGIGLGIIIRQGASSGGSDFAALIFNHCFPHISVSHFILFIDMIIIIASGFIFHSFAVTFYSALSLFVSIKTVDAILSFGNAAKSIFILSEKTEEIAGSITESFSRGVTGIHAKGMYRKNEKLMLLSVVTPKELPPLIHLIRQTDPAAFIIIFDAREVLGEGFKSEPTNA